MQGRSRFALSQNLMCAHALYLVLHMWVTIRKCNTGERFTTSRVIIYFLVNTSLFSGVLSVISYSNSVKVLISDTNLSKFYCRYTSYTATAHLLHPLPATAAGNEAEHHERRIKDFTVLVVLGLVACINRELANKPCCWMPPGFESWWRNKNT